MSGFIDFIVAHPKDADAVAKENSPKSRWPSTAAKFVCEYHLMDL